MSGFFSNMFDSNKPGKGISKEQVMREREKVTVGGFFKIFKRKFWQMMQLNMLAFLFFVPLLLIFYVCSVYIVPVVLPMTSSSADQAYVALWHTINTATNNLIAQNAWWTDLSMRMILAIIFVIFPVIAIGPIQAGFTYILQSFIREKPVFLTHDFFARAKSNFWQSLAVSAIDFVVTAIFVLEIYLYNNILRDYRDGSILWSAGMVFMVILFIIFLLMHIYIYPILVTFNVNLRQLYKNSFLLTMTSFFPSILILLLDAAIIFLVFSFITAPIYQILILAVFLLGFLGLINNYFGYKYIKFHLLDPALEAADAERIAKEENGDTVS